MNQKELYIQYLEDALNHAKTGEPMKHWQWRYKEEVDSDFDGSWLETDVCTFIMPDKIDLRIKPEPFKWTTFAYRTAESIGAWVQHGGHFTREELAYRTRVLTKNILAIHYHEVEEE